MADATYWKQQISEYNKAFEPWEKRTGRIIDRYTDSGKMKATYANSSSRYNILWSNIQTAMPAVFSRLPRPDVSRRFKDSDPVGRVAAMILERALDYEVSFYPDYRTSVEACIFDRFIGARGTAWVRYEPKFKALQEQINPDGLQVTEDIGAEKISEASEYTDNNGMAIEYECCPVDYVPWRDFGHTVARTWEEVTAVWRKVYMGKDALVERFGKELAEKIPLDTMPEELKGNTLPGIKDNYQAIIYEIWDKGKSKVYWLSKGLNEIVDEKDDPLELTGFFPCPVPLYGTITTDSLVPIPDFSMYQDQAQAIDIICDRIMGLIKALRVRGVYNASMPDLKRLFTEGENNTLVPVDSWLNFAEKQGLKGSIDLVDIAPFAVALAECYKALEQQKQQIYEITGLSDLLRGTSDPRETLGAQELKGQFGSMRLRAMQQKVAQFCTDIIRIKAEIICKHFQPDTIIKISGANFFVKEDIPLIQQAIQLLKSAPMMCFRIDIEADSLVNINEMQDKKDRVEFLGAATNFLKEALPMATQAPEITPLIVEMLKFGVTGFKVGKSIEGLIDQFSDSAKQKMLQQAQQPNEKPDPEQMKLQLEQQKIQMLSQNDMQKHDSEMRIRQVEQQNQAAIQQQENDAQKKRDEQKARLDMAERQHEAELKVQVEQQKLEFEKYKFEEEMKFKMMMRNIDTLSNPEII